MTDSRTTRTHDTHTRTYNADDGRFRAIIEPADDDIRTLIPGAAFYVEIFDHDADAIAFEDTFDTFDRAEKAVLNALTELVECDGVWGPGELERDARLLGLRPDDLVTDPHDPYFNDADDNTLGLAR